MALVCRVELSLRSKGDRKELLKKLKEGQVVRGTIQHIKDIGLFVQLEHTNLTGFVHKSQISDKFVSDINDSHKIGQGGLPFLESRMDPLGMRTAKTYAYILLT